MRARDKRRVGALRLILADIQRFEVDERVDADDEMIIAILDKMGKQRRDSMAQFNKAGRDDLAEQEAFEIEILNEFLPAQLSEAELMQIVQVAIATVGASSMKDMGSVMGQVRPQVQGRADMSVIGTLVKEKLNS